MKWIYSVSVSVPKPKREEWLSWMQREHIPDMMATGCFEDFILQELLEPIPYPDMFTFNVQYFCATKEQYDHYLQTAASTLRSKTQDRFGNQLQAFRTLLKHIS